jgi:hypothetical protein
MPLFEYSGQIYNKIGRVRLLGRRLWDVAEKSLAAVAVWEDE